MNLASKQPVVPVSVISDPSATQEASSVENPIAGGTSLSIDGVNKDTVQIKMGKPRKLGGEHSGNGTYYIESLTVMGYPMTAVLWRRCPPSNVHSFVFGSQTFIKDSHQSYYPLCVPGKNKDKWQEQVFTLTSEELWWTSKQTRKSVKLADMGAVTEWSDIGIGHAFEVITRVKDGKVYKFSAADDADRDAWIDQLRTLIPPA